MFSTSDPNECVSRIRQISLKVTSHTPYTEGINLWRCATTKLWSGNLTLYSKCTRRGACNDAAARPSGTRALSSLDRNRTVADPNNLQISCKSSMKLFANIRSTFFFLKVFSGLKSFTGTVWTCRFPCFELERRGCNRRYVADLLKVIPMWTSFSCKSSSVLTVLPFCADHQLQSLLRQFSL